jgi:hypothetical protein
VRHHIFNEHLQQHFRHPHPSNPLPHQTLRRLLVPAAQLLSEALQASEKRRSEVEEENAGLAECLSEALDLLEHRAAVHKARVATLEHEVQEKTELKEANERLLKEKQQRMASLSVRLDSWIVGWCCCCCYCCCCWVFIGFCLLFPLFFLPFFF